MIAYQGMAFRDWHFYWGESVLFHKHKGKWIGVVPSNTPDGEYRYRSGELLEDIGACGGELVFTPVPSRTLYGHITCHPMAPFQSSDWVTYEPPLGYFVFEGKLTLLTSRVPRNRYKGLHPNRLRTLPPVDEGAVSSPVFARITANARRAELVHNNFYDLVQEIARRMNDPFSPSWYQAIYESLVGERTDSPVILANTTAFIPEPNQLYGHLLHTGTMLGRVTLTGARLRFTPRGKISTVIEQNVNAWIKSQLVATPTQHGLINPKGDIS